MSDNKDKIESFFKLREGKQSTNLGLKELFSILEQFESSNIPTIDVKAKKTESEKELFKAINSRLAKIIGEGQSVETKLKNLESYLNNLKTNDSSNLPNPPNFNEVLTVIITINSLFQMIQSYTPQVAGKLFEYFIELMFGGKVETNENQIVDIVAGNNEFWSLKLLSGIKPTDERYGVQGSITQAINFFNGDNTKTIKYLVAFKESTDTLAFYTVDLNLEKFTTFLNDPTINKPIDDKKFNFDKSKFTEGAKPVATLILSEQDVKNIITNNQKIFTNQVNTVLGELKDLKEVATTYFVSGRAADGKTALQKSKNVTNNLRDIVTGKKY